MTTVAYDDRSFLVDGKRIWLVSGSMHYFRIPAALWRDRLLKAKRAGLNCITTPVAWNVHEPVEGQWDLSGDNDVGAFVRLAGELGLYVILRPGPYIGADWDCGGLPGWLTAKSGVTLRSSNAAFTHYYDKYFRNVLSALADLQVTRGGNIILIQNEYEYVATTMPDRLTYLEFISQLFRRSGFDVPIITCNCFSDPAPSDVIECVNGWGNEVQLLKRMRLRQPNAPLLMTEFRCATGDVWGRKGLSPEPREVARRAMSVLGCGAQCNYTMWHGGTNFAFWAGRRPESDDAYTTTSYDCGAPLTETGQLTETYYHTRLVNMLANHMGRFFASSILEQPGVNVHDSTGVLNLSGPQCDWAIITNNGRQDITSAWISLPEGQNLDVPLGRLGATAIPIELDLGEVGMLDYANLTPLGLFGANIIVFHGPTGFEARISINGKEIRGQVPKDTAPALIEHEQMLIVLVNTDTAMRTWLVEDALVFGADFVGEKLGDAVLPAGTRQCPVLSLEGKLTTYKQTPTRAKKPPPPRLRPWRRLAVCPEPTDDELDWKKVDGPRDVDHLGIHQGYAWYRIDIDVPRAKKYNLFLPSCEDRATLLLNGKRVGVWRGDLGAARKPISAAFNRGVNVLVALVDNLGRFSAGTRIDGLKGLFDHVYDAKTLRHGRFKLKCMESFSRRLVPRQQAHLLDELEGLQAWSADLAIPLAKVAPVHVSFRSLAHHVAIICNDRTVAFLANEGTNFADVTLGNELRKGKNVLRLVLWGDVTPKTLQSVDFHVLAQRLSDQAKWGVRPWSPRPQENQLPCAGRPAWYASSFKWTPRDGALALKVAGSKKGQIILNGHNIGRFWTIAPQQEYYLPECHLVEDNEILIFAENGQSPSQAKLIVVPRTAD